MKAVRGMTSGKRLLETYQGLFRNAAVQKRPEVIQTYFPIAINIRRLNEINNIGERAKKLGK